MKMLTVEVLFTFEQAVSIVNKTWACEYYVTIYKKHEEYLITQVRQQKNNKILGIYIFLKNDKEVKSYHQELKTNNAYIKKQDFCIIKSYYDQNYLADRKLTFKCIIGNQTYKFLNGRRV